jgi:hypothetical protein
MCLTFRGVGLAAVAVFMIAISVRRLAKDDHARPGRARDRAAICRAGVVARAAVLLITREIDFAAVCDHAIAVTV